MPRPRLLDLFCGAGGSAEGYHRAGFEVVGVDIAPQPRYPFEFHQADAFTYPLDGFDVIHASPPCQRYSDLARRNRNADAHPDYIGPMRDRLRQWAWSTGWRGVYVIENVEGAPLRDPIWLCGTMFEGLRVIRHRGFESNAPLVAPSHPPRHPLCFTMDKRKSNYGKGDPWRDFVHVNGGGNAPVAAKRDAMGIDWPMTGREVNEAIPPAYAEHIGKQIRQQIRLGGTA